MDLAFFKKPILEIKPNNSFADKAKELFISILWMYGFLFLVTILLKIADFLIKNKTNFSFYEILLSQQHKNFSFSVFYLITLGPILEELVFRLPLVLNKKKIIISLSLACFLLAGTRFSESNLYSINTVYKTVSIVLIGIITHFFLKESYLQMIKGKYYPIYFYSITVLFGLVHLFNFYKIVPMNLLIFAPLFVLPQIILGAFTGYIRLKNGLIWSIIMHCIFNIPGFLSLLSHR